jgi:poly(beta-D-mannuronate) lyase
MGLARQVIVAWVLGVMALQSPAVAALVPPWTVTIGAVKPLSIQATCAALPDPVISLATQTIYESDDASRSEIDPESQQKYLAEIAPVRTYLRQLVGATNKFALSHGKNREAGQCAARGLVAWARAGALADATTDIAMFNRATFLAGISSAYIQIRESPELSSGDHEMIEAWLASLLRQTQAFYDKKRQSTTFAPNNIQYWGSLGVAMASIATGDAESLKWAVDAVRLGACQATAEGALPREVARKQRALHYHLFAIAPLVMLAEIGERNGLPGYEVCGGALHRVIDFALAGVDDPEAMARLAGVKQLTITSLKSDTDLAWLEPYAQRFPAKAWRLAAIRPLSNSYLGGNLTRLYGH